MIVFSRVSDAEGGAAYAWFTGFAASNDAIYKRDHAWFNERLMEGALWRASEAKTTLGLVYVYYDPTEHAWELGGLMVSDQARGRGIGLALMRIALAHMLFEQDPFEADAGTRIVAHVLKRNPAPRGILDKMHFEATKPIREPAANLPGLIPDADGFVNGDEFELEVPQGLSALASWLLCRDGSLAADNKGVIRSKREAIDATVWGHAIEDIAGRFSPPGPTEGPPLSA